MKVKNLFLLILLGGFIVSGCGSKQDASEDSAEADTAMETKKYPLTAFPSSPKFSDATLTDMSLQNGTFSFNVGGSSYQLGEQTSDADTKMCANSGQGQHIHLIIDSQPYSAQYTATFDYEVSNGDHNLLAFLSRSYHESIKTDEAHIAQRVTVQDGNITASEDISEPTLFYSRPKGTYVGEDTKKIMLDFYPVNAEIGTDYKVKVQINGEVTLLDEWKPYFIENLPMGQNTIGIALVYPDGSPVPGRQTSILRTIELRQDPLPEM